MNDRQQKTGRLLAEHLRRKAWREDPLLYFEERLGIPRWSIDWSLIPGYEKHRWDGTPNPLKTAADALVKWKWVGIESAVSTGKTFFGAAIALWFLESFENSLVITTAPVEKQLTLYIWKEIQMLYERAELPGDLNKLRYRMIPGSDEWLLVGFVSGQKSGEQSATTGQGAHRKDLLIIGEEMPGIPAARLTALVNTCTAPHNLFLGLGNPDHQLDELHKFCEQDNVVHVRISGYDHPNVVTGDADLIPGAQSRTGIQRLLDKYRDKEHPFYKSRARGICPAQSVDSLIKLEWLYAARDKWRALRDEHGDEELYLALTGQKRLGVDVANSTDGDRAAIAYGVENVCCKVEDFQCPNSNQLGHRVATEMKDDGIPPECVGVDGIGVGAGTVNTLNDDHDFRVNNLMGGAGAIDLGDGVEEFANLRAQMYWVAREDLRLGRIAAPDDEELFADLVTPKYVVRGKKILIESKDDLKKRLGRSPNKGDAFVYWNFVRRLSDAFVPIEVSGEEAGLLDDLQAQGVTDVDLEDIRDVDTISGIDTLDELDDYTDEFII